MLPSNSLVPGRLYGGFNYSATAFSAPTTWCHTARNNVGRQIMQRGRGWVREQSSQLIQRHAPDISGGMQRMMMRMAKVTKASTSWPKVKLKSVLHGPCLPFGIGKWRTCSIYHIVLGGRLCMSVRVETAHALNPCSRVLAGFAEASALEQLLLPRREVILGHWRRCTARVAVIWHQRQG